MSHHDAPPPRGSHGWIGWTVGLLLVAVVLAIAIPALIGPTCRITGEMQAPYSLKMLASAQADFRANDRDGNRINDFWTADVKGLYTMTSALEKGTGDPTRDPALMLIEMSIAAADADGDTEAAAARTTRSGISRSPRPRRDTGTASSRRILPRP